MKDGRKEEGREKPFSQMLHGFMVQKLLNTLPLLL